MADSNFSYPIFLSLTGRRALVVGGGKVALRKAQDLADAGAAVCVVAPKFLAALRKDNRLRCHKAVYEARMLGGMFLVIAATDDETVNARVAADAAEACVMANVVDRPSLCDFIVPAVVRRGRLTVAVSTGGAAPSLARRLRERIEKDIGPEFAAYLDVMDEVRRKVQSRGLPEETRRRIFERLSEDDIVATARKGKKALRQVVEKILKDK
jgi:precorrin-2 dehydrogenase / sirohydrochlorin ferrochelatase